MENYRPAERCLLIHEALTRPCLIRHILMLFVPCIKCTKHVWYPGPATDSWASFAWLSNFVSQPPDSAANSLLTRWPVFWLLWFWWRTITKNSKIWVMWNMFWKIVVTLGKISCTFLSCENCFKLSSYVQRFPNVELWIIIGHEYVPMYKSHVEISSTFHSSSLLFVNGQMAVTLPTAAPSMWNLGFIRSTK